MLRKGYALCIFAVIRRADIWWYENFSLLKNNAHRQPDKKKLREYTHTQLYFCFIENSEILYNNQLILYAGR